MTAFGPNVLAGFIFKFSVKHTVRWALPRLMAGVCFTLRQSHSL